MKDEDNLCSGSLFFVLFRPRPNKKNTRQWGLLASGVINGRRQYPLRLYLTFDFKRYKLPTRIYINQFSFFDHGPSRHDTNATL